MKLESYYCRKWEHSPKLKNGQKPPKKWWEHGKNVRETRYLFEVIQNKHKLW